MVAPADNSIERHRRQARDIANEIGARAELTYGNAWKRTAIASVLGAYATTIVDYLAQAQLTGQQKREIALAGGKLLAITIAAAVRPSLGLGVWQLTHWLEALIEITCSEGTP